VWCPAPRRQGRGWPGGLQRPLRGSAGERPVAELFKVSPVGVSVGEHRPNKRLKLSGARVGRIALPRQRAFFSAAPPPCACGHCARSLSAIR
jgi:hypothetical protein